MTHTIYRKPYIKSNYKTIVNLRLEENLTIREISQRLNVHDTTVSKALNSSYSKISQRYVHVKKGYNSMHRPKATEQEINDMIELRKFCSIGEIAGILKRA